MKMSIGDITDRYTICKLKSERLGLDNTDEVNELLTEIKQYDGIDSFVNDIYDANASIWDLESDIRQGKVAELGYEEIGKRSVAIRQFNAKRIEIKNQINAKFNEGYLEIKMNHGSHLEKSVVISLTTVPERLLHDNEDGIEAVIKSLCEQDDVDYEIHFNIPTVYKQTGNSYSIPYWLNQFKLKYPHLKIFRVDDIGPPTKLVPTLLRVTNEETIIIVVDDDLIYHPDMIKEHRKYQVELKDSVICYDGRGVKEPVYNDVRDAFVLCVTEIRRVTSMQHYKSASYKKKIFDQDFFDYYVGRTLSDDALVSKYFRDKNINMYVVPYTPEIENYKTVESWQKNHGVETFPVIKHAHMPQYTGANHPKILEKEPKFYEPSTLGNKNIPPEKQKHTEKIITNEVNMSFVRDRATNIIQALRVYDVKSPKFRLGPNKDGGYVINQKLFESCKRLISIGVGMEDTFENDWLRLVENSQVEAYEGHSTCYDLCHKNQDLLNKRIFYIPHLVGYESGQIPLNIIVDGKKNILLKVDIEGAEYNVFENVKLTDVGGLLIEIHDLANPQRRQQLINLIENQFSELVLFHIHANSWGNTFDLNLSSNNSDRGIIIKDFPHTLELSFIHKSLVDEYELDKTSYPINNLDYSNKEDSPDIDLYWVNAL